VLGQSSKIALAPTSQDVLVVVIDQGHVSLSFSTRRFSMTAPMSRRHDPLGCDIEYVSVRLHFIGFHSSADHHGIGLRSRSSRRTQPRKPVVGGGGLAIAPSAAAGTGPWRLDELRHEAA
jgi:hypothetical protein